MVPAQAGDIVRMRFDCPEVLDLAGQCITFGHPQADHSKRQQKVLLAVNAFNDRSKNRSYRRLAG